MVLKYNFIFCELTLLNPSCRSEYDGDLQSQLLNKANEEDKNCSRALSVVSAVVRAAKDLLHRALAVDGKAFEDWLSKSTFQNFSDSKR